MSQQMNTKSSVRNSSIELCRIIAMLLIVISHTYTCGMGAWNWSHDGGIVLTANIVPQTFIASFFYFGVNIFILISGYFLIKPNITKFVHLYVVVAFYTLLGLIFHQCQMGEFSVINTVVQTIFPFGKQGGGYWFVECYLYLFLIAPILNAAIDKLNNKQFLYATLLLGIIDVYFGYFWQRPAIDGTGYCFTHFIFLYCLGRCLKNYQAKINQIKYIKTYTMVVYVISAVTIFLMFYLSASIQPLRFRTHCHSNPFSIIGAVALFVFFTQYNFNNRWINIIATTTFGIYLFQGNRYFIYAIYDNLQLYTNINMFVTFFVGVGLFLIGVIVDFLLQFIYKPIGTGLVKTLQTITKKDL